MNCVGQKIHRFLLVVVLVTALQDRSAMVKSNGRNSLPHLVPKDNLCPGDLIFLKWNYTAADRVIEIVWNYTEFGGGKVPITIARRTNFATGKSQIYDTKFRERLHTLDDKQTTNAGILLFASVESDEGIFDVKISLENQNQLTDSVSVYVNAHRKNQVIANENTVCIVESWKARLGWTVSGISDSHPCLLPSSAIWSKDATKLATYIAASLTGPSSFSVHQSDFIGRLSYPESLVLQIVPSKTSDKGDYLVDATFVRNYTVRSSASRLVVKSPGEVMPLADMVVCFVDEFSLPWQFRHGTSCNGQPTTILLVTWVNNENASIGQRDSSGTRLFVSGAREGRTSKLGDSIQWLEILLKPIKNFGEGRFGVLVDVNDQDGLKQQVSRSVSVTTEVPHEPTFYYDRPPRFINKCVRETVYLNWEYYYPPQKACKPANASSITLFHQNSIIYNSKLENQNSGGANLRRDLSTNAGFVISNLDESRAGSYSIRVDFPKDVLLHDTVRVQIFDNPKLTDPTANSSCSDDKYHADWGLVWTRCPNPLKIQWFIKSYEENKTYMVGYRPTLDDSPVIDKNFRRHVRVGDSKVDIQFKELWKLVSGDYPKKLQIQAKLLYPSTPDDILSHEVLTDVLIHSATSDVCTGVQLRDIKFNVTRDGEDVSMKSNLTVAVNDELKLSVTIPRSDSDPKPIFFWQEPQHTNFRHYFMHKCPSKTECHMVWKITKRSIPITFLQSEDRKLITVGVKVTFMSVRSTMFDDKIFIGNLLDVKKTGFSKQNKGEGWTIQKRHQLKLNLFMVALAMLLGCRLW